VPDDGRFPLATHSRDSPADGTIFPVPHTSSLLADFPWFCHGLLVLLCYKLDTFC